MDDPVPRRRHLARGFRLQPVRRRAARLSRSKIQGVKAGIRISLRRDGMKVRDAIWLIEDDGWKQVATRGSHRQFKHPVKPGRVTIAGKPSAPGTFNSILKQSGLKEPR